MTCRDDIGAAVRATVKRRLYQYPGCTGFVVRFFIECDLVPKPYLSEAEALAELQRRRDEAGKRGAA